MIIQTNELTRVQLHQLNELEELCQKADQGAPALYRHLLIEKRPTASTLLYYKNLTTHTSSRLCSGSPKHSGDPEQSRDDVREGSEQPHKNEQLVGFLSVYFFYNDACEISLLVHPNYRRQKIATRLLQQILPLLTEKSIQRVIFSTSPTLTWLSKQGFIYIESEYRMERLSAMPEPLTTSVLTISHATIEDIPALVEIEKFCFSSETNTPQHFADLLKNPHYTLWVAKYQGKSIGKAHLRKQDETVSFLSDIAILPIFQGQGFASELLAYAINEVLMQGTIKLALDVTTNEQSKAFNLYSRHGFKVTQQYDYWAVLLEQLRSLLVL